MTQTQAMAILVARGWNSIGAEEILWDLSVDELTEAELARIAEDYEDR